MLEVVNAAGVLRQGEAKLEFSSAYQGYITYIKGVDADGGIVVSCPNSSAQSAQSYYPIKKLRFEEDLSDTADAVDKLKRNDRVVYYEGGEFITDRFTRASLAFGKAVPSSTAETRGDYGVDLVVTTVAPSTLLYVTYWGSLRGQLTATSVGTQLGGVYANDKNVARFRLIKAWAATAAISGILNADSARSQVRFAVIPGVLTFDNQT